MTNPYAQPKDVSGPKSSGSTPSLLAQIIWHALAGGAYAALYLYVNRQFPGWYGASSEVPAIALLCIAFACRAWFCRGSRELIAAATAVSWGLLWSAWSGTILYCIQTLTIPPGWGRLIVLHAILPAVLTLIGWPVMYIAQRRRHQRLERQSSGDDE